MPSSLLRFSILATVLLAAPPAEAEDTLPPAPWKTLKAAFDTVGTCATDAFTEVETCYLMRCEPQVGLVFAIREAGLGDAAVERVRLTVGRRHLEFGLHGAAPNERWVRAKAVPGLLALLTSGATWAGLETTKAKMMYGTGFDLAGARTAIETLAGRCGT